MSNSKIALVTGGSRGLGKDMALSIAGKGLDVIVTYRSEAGGAEDTVQQIEALGRKAASLPLDLSVAGAATAFAGELERLLRERFESRKIDFLVNNAGIGGTLPFGTVTEAQFDEFLNVHFKGVYFLTQTLLPQLNDGGGIINISTGTTRFVNPGYSVYASMKGAIEVFTRYLAKELGPKGIRANVVAPGPIETDFNNAAIRNNPQLKERLSAMTPLGRVGVAEDVGPVVAFLCTEDARWVNAQRIEVSGGINA
ncbi:SDR family oxidoreductase [Flaviaesturariibacter flavus]|uniref:SDR family oxidoreductase n=1 Tax=Flaviaesturariibacter flavus TaxID=2502780 RepID=A0A4V2NVE1_9BACT|nr:SDR family oxidoreductase [Flaviaesturariibacter flavus]TCJ13156.1 SDR family oxidoreductase [Flaviaesturariibacter flavus]